MLIFLYGEDEFRSAEKLKEIKNKFLEKNSSGSGLSYFDLEENKSTNFSEIKEAFGSKGLFFSKQLIIIKNLMVAGQKELISKITDFLKSIKNLAEDKEKVLIFWEKGKINEKSELFKFLKSKAKSQNFSFLAQAKLKEWIMAKFSKENEKVKISAKALEKLEAYTGGDLQILENEIKKLANYKEEGIISEDDIEILVNEKINAKIFEAIEALSSGNKKIALKLFHQQLQKGEDPLYVLAMYVYQFRNFLKVSEYWERGESDSYDIAKKAGIQPFVVKKILGQIARFPTEKLKAVYKRLQKIDEETKTGKRDAKVELDRFIVEI
jgi:DNA polymerase III subunit delta